MKIIILASIIVLFAFGAAFSQSNKEKTKISAQIRKVLDVQVAAWNQGDIEGFMQGYWKSEELSFTSGNTKTQGWQATYERYKKGYDSREKMGRLSFSELDIMILNKKSAMVRGRFLLVRKTDKPTGLFTLIFRKFKHGWKVIHDHTSS